MSIPLPLLSDHLAAQLTDPTSALAAAFIIANRYPEILQWAGRRARPGGFARALAASKAKRKVPEGALSWTSE
jgi:hypothetical protein